MYEVEHPQGTNKLYAQYSCGDPRKPQGLDLSLVTFEVIIVAHDHSI